MQTKKYTNIEQYKGQLVAEIASSTPRILKKFQDICITSEKPRTWGLETESSPVQQLEYPQVSIVNQLEDSSKFKFSEHDLYPKLSVFLKSLPTKVYSKRIDERRSSNKEGKNANIWTHPDLVGLEVLDQDYDDILKQTISHLNDRKINLWSCEVKLEINLSNIRECFFQAVSNSSWSNYGYVVTADIDEKAFKEFRMLSQAHKIGLIILNFEDISRSDIKIPESIKDDLDWHMINNLYKNNPDFKEFIKLVKEYHLTGNVKEYEWG